MACLCVLYDYNKGHMESQKDNFLKDNKNLVETMDKSLALSAKRAGNIATAIYIVSNILPANEPLQNELRKASLSLLSIANDIAGRKGESYDRQTAEINTVIKKIISYLEVGVTMFLVSEMNFRILRLELMALGGSYESRRDGLFEIESLLKSESHKGQEILTEEKSPKPERIIKRTENDKGHLKKPLMINVLNKQLAPTFGSKSFIKDKSTDSENRKEKILNNLKNKDKKTIGDIKNDFPDVSFKTIQRDLQSLMDEGKIERIGERRWSMYRVL